MRYRTLGRTNLEVSQLGFGCMRLPMVEGKDNEINRELAIPMLHRALEAGVNYFDTAVGYCGGDSQRVVGEAFEHCRDKVVISTKNHYYDDDESAWWKNLEDSLRRLRTDHIDIYNHHGITWQKYEEAVAPRVGAWMHKAKEQGLIKHICASFHDTNDSLMKIIDADYVDVITLQYNLLDRQLEEGIAYAKEKNIGVVVMGPVAGGRLGEPSGVFGEMVKTVNRVPELAMRFVLANPNVAVALSGMSTMEQVEENLATTSDEIRLTDEDLNAIDAHLVRLKKLAELYCTGCKYCMPCPAEVNISTIFDAANKGKVYGLWDTAKKMYAYIGKVPFLPGKTADACTECGQCEEKCPQNIPIRQQLKEAHKELSAKD